MLVTQTKTLHLREGFVYRFVCVFFSVFTDTFHSLSSKLGLGVGRPLNTVRKFPKFVRHLVRVLKVILFKVFLDFRFDWAGRRSETEREKKIVK